MKKNELELCTVDMPKIIFQKVTCAKKCLFAHWTPSETFSDQLIEVLIGGEICFPQNGSCWVSKCPPFCVDFKNVNLP
jgi:hypothetical protein